MVFRKRTLFIPLICLSIIGNVVLIYMMKNYMVPLAHFRKTMAATCDGQCIQNRGTHLGGNDDFGFPDWKTTTQGHDDTTGNFTFLINPRHACSWNPKDTATMKLAIMVVSKIDNFVLRYTIRKTWGSFDRKIGPLVFLVGTTEDKNLQQQLRKEADTYNDIIQVNVTDAYNLLTYKSIAMLEWFYRYCRGANYYLKADDDAYLNVENVYNATISFVAKRFLFCAIHQKVKPIRNSHSKWYVTKEEFGGTYYPSYCAGPAYVMTSSLLSDLYTASLHAKFVPLEDIYITGIATEKLGATLIHSPKFFFAWTNKKVGCTLKEMYSLHKVESQDMPVIYSYCKGQKCGKKSK